MIQMTDEERTRTYQALSDKRIVLSTFIRTPLTDENRDELGPAMSDAEIELLLLDAMISDLLNDAPMAYPGDVTINDLRRLTAAAAVAIQNSANVAALAAAAHALIDAWPAV
jgi:hypothetical protein